MEAPPSKSTPYWDEVADQWSDGRHQLWRQVSDAVNRLLLERWLPDHSPSVLKTDAFDEAVSPGLYSALDNRAGAVVEIDVSLPLLIAARKNCPDMLTVSSDVRRLPFADASFDSIVSLSTLDHFSTIAEMETSLAGLRALLKPGGCLIVTLDNPLNPLVRVRNALPFRWLNRVGLVPYYVGATCGPRELERLLVAAGFRVTDAAALLHVPRVFAVAIARLIDRRDSASLARWYLRCALAFESLSKLPTRYRTGHFIAVRATTA